MGCDFPVGKRQICDELFSQVGDLRRADMDISGCKQFNNGMIRQMIFKKGFSHINKDIVADVTTRWNYSGKLF